MALHLRIPVQLKGWRDWYSWYSMFKNRAQTLQIWELIDPDQPDQEGDIIKFPKVPLKDDYKEDGQTEPLTSKQWQYFNEAKADYFTLKEVAQEKQKGYLVMQSLFDSSVEKKLLRPTLKHQTLRQKLKTLRATVNSKDQDVPRQLLADLMKLKSTPYGQNVTEYLDKWVDLFHNVEEHAVNCSGRYMFPENAMCEELIYALQPFYPFQAESKLDALWNDSSVRNSGTKNGDEVSLLAEVRGWKSYIGRQKTDRFATKAATAAKPVW